jgi:flagellar protein FliS
MTAEEIIIMSNASKYRDVQVLTADKLRIVIMLYEGVLRFNRAAQQAIKDGQIELRNYNVNRSIAIVTELRDALNMEEGGMIAQKLLSLYIFSIEHLTSGNLENNVDYIENVNKVFEELKGGWEHIAAERPADAAQPTERVSISHGA